MQQTSCYSSNSLEQVMHILHLPNLVCILAFTFNLESIALAIIRRERRCRQIQSARLTFSL